MNEEKIKLLNDAKKDFDAMSQEEQISKRGKRLAEKITLLEEEIKNSEEQKVKRYKTRNNNVINYNGRSYRGEVKPALAEEILKEKGEHVFTHWFEEIN